LADSELSIAVVGDRTIRRINRDYLQKDRPTNVISFSLREGEFGDVNPSALGDVVISADTAAREAVEGGLFFQERFCFLLLHGILHLSGYDHERSGEAEAQRMEAKELDIFAILKQEGLV
jgi:probable rRNA maturation factor